MSKHFRLFHVNARMDFEPQGAHLLSTFSNHLFFVRVHKYYLSESKYCFRNIFFSKFFFVFKDAITTDASLECKDAIVVRVRDAMMQRCNY